MSVYPSFVNLWNLVAVVVSNSVSTPEIPRSVCVTAYDQGTLAGRAHTRAFVSVGCFTMNRMLGAVRHWKFLVPVLLRTNRKRHHFSGLDPTWHRRVALRLPRLVRANCVSRISSGSTASTCRRARS
jgi:hypothetical protein